MLVDFGSSRVSETRDHLVQNLIGDFCRYRDDGLLERLIAQEHRRVQVNATRDESYVA